MPEKWNYVLVSHIDRYFLTDPFLFVMFFFGYSASWYCLLNLEAFFFNLLETEKIRQMITSYSIRIKDYTKTKVLQISLKDH